MRRLKRRISSLPPSCARAELALESVDVTDTTSRVNLFELDRTGLEDFFEQTLGEKRFRAHQVMKWMYHRYVTDFEQMTDLGKA
mgnify:CR=1 FL=1